MKDFGFGSDPFAILVFMVQLHCPLLTYQALPLASLVEMATDLFRASVALPVSSEHGCTLDLLRTTVNVVSL